MSDDPGEGPGAGSAALATGGEDALPAPAEAPPPAEVPPDVAARLVRALDRAPSAFVTLIDADMRTRWLSTSTSWVTGTEPTSRSGRHSMERVHPDDVERLLFGMAQLREAVPTSTPGAAVMEPLRYRVRRPGGGWQTVEAIVQNLLHDPEVAGLLVIGRPVGELDGPGQVLDLLVADRPLGEVLAACAQLLPAYLGTAAVVALLEGEPVVGLPADEAAAELAADERWWRSVLAEGRGRTPVDFDGFPEELASRAREAGYRSAWVLPLTEPDRDEVIGCVVVWVRIAVKRNIATDHGLRQIERLATLVIGEQRRLLALRREAITDPLTGVGNRSALRRRLDEAAGPVTVALVDLDDFKPVNDTYGHETGDVVLRVVAERLVATVREGDCVVRLGGDEFAVVFAAGTPTDGVAGSAERLVEAIETPIDLDAGLTLTVRASVGLATGPVADVVHRADAALYAIKRAKLRS